MLLTSRWNRQLAANVLDRAAHQVDTYRQAVERGEDLHHVHDRILIGSGQPAYEAAATALASFGMHRQAGLRVASSTPSVSLDGCVVLGLPIGPLQVLVPCRVSEIWESASVSGFSYVTLPGHPECGYEKFLVERAPDDDVYLEIWSESRSSIATLRPLTMANRFFQKRITHRYQQALRSIAEQTRESDH